MRELLSNISQFVGQLYEDKSLALRARDLISFTTDFQTVKLFLNNSLLELMYFLNTVSKACSRSYMGLGVRKNLSSEFVINKTAEQPESDQRFCYLLFGK